MNSLYPINLNLSGRKVSVIGGGKIAERKVKGLLATGALIDVVSPELSLELKKWLEDNQFTWREMHFSPEVIEGAFMVIAATNDHITNQWVKESAQSQQLVCLVDDPGQSDFLLPSNLRRGKLTISVSTCGASPILAKKIRDHLAQSFDENYEDYLEFLAQARKLIIEKVDDEGTKRQLLTSIVDDRFLECDNREEEFQKLWNRVFSGS